MSTEARNRLLAECREKLLKAVAISKDITSIERSKSSTAERLIEIFFGRGQCKLDGVESVVLEVGQGCRRPDAIAPLDAVIPSPVRVMSAQSCVGLNLKSPVGNYSEVHGQTPERHDAKEYIFVHTPSHAKSTGAESTSYFEVGEKYLNTSPVKSPGQLADELLASASTPSAQRITVLESALKTVVDEWSSQFERHGHMAPGWVKVARAALGSSSPSISGTQFCSYPDCNCPFDAPSDPDWCARGLTHDRKPKAP